MKKSTLILLVIIIAWLWLPTGDPSDVIAFGIMAKIGASNYTIISVILIFIVWQIIDGTTMSDKMNTVHKHARRLVR